MKLSKLEEIRRRLDEALRKGEITKEVRDQILGEAEAKHRQRMIDLARRLAELEPDQPRAPSKAGPATGDEKAKKSSNWLMLGLFATAAAALAIYHMQTSHNHRIKNLRKKAGSPAVANRIKNLRKKAGSPSLKKR
ncbi:hypothetical protein KEJ39_05895 [Candidatus Bathyarchaeota archaeon]|nr:hypothetical protein [Candidatus Bathyarchaeota archaeon]